jgi:hypothetical protein
MLDVDAPRLPIAKSQLLSPDWYPANYHECLDPGLRWRPADDPQPRILPLLPLLPFVVARLGQPFRSRVLPMPVGMASKPGLSLHIRLSLAARFGALNLALMHGQTTSSLL